MMLSNSLELIYWSDDGGTSLPLEEWQYQAIVQLLGLSVVETDGSLKFSCFTKETVAKRLKKMGVLVTPEQYDRLKGDDNNG